MELTKKKSFATYSCITINIDYFSKLKCQVYEKLGTQNLWIIKTTIYGINK